MWLRTRRTDWWLFVVLVRVFSHLQVIDVGCCVLMMSSCCEWTLHETKAFEHVLPVKVPTSILDVYPYATYFFALLLVLSTACDDRVTAGASVQDLVNDDVADTRLAVVPDSVMVAPSVLSSMSVR